MARLALLTLALAQLARVQGDAPAAVGERRCDHDNIGIVVASERATELAFEERQGSRQQGDVLDQARSLRCLLYPELHFESCRAVRSLCRKVRVCAALQRAHVVQL